MTQHLHTHSSKRDIFPSYLALIDDRCDLHYFFLDEPSYPEQERHPSHFPKIHTEYKSDRWTLRRLLGSPSPIKYSSEAHSDEERLMRDELDYYTPSN
jgi:hypothetical protein